MDALKLLRRLAYYLLYFVLVVLVYYFVTAAGLSFFHEEAWPLTEESVLNDVLLPYLYAFVSLGVALFLQFLFIRKPVSSNERKIYGWGLVALYLFHLGITVIVLIVGGVSVSENTPSYLLLLVPCLPLLILACGELFYAALLLSGAYREGKSPEVANSLHQNNEIASTDDYNE